MARTTTAEPATTTAANSGGTRRSILDLVTRSTGKQMTAPVKSDGTLTVASPHFWEKEEDGEIAETNANSGANDATATNAVRRVVHAVA